MEYHKIETVFRRDPETKHRTLLEGQYANPALEYLKDCRWRYTEKVDGTNIRVGICSEGDGRFELAGRTDNSQIPAALVQVLRDTFEPMQDILAAEFPDGGTLHGEGYGARIQKGGGNYRSDQGFVLFDVMVGPWWLEHHSVMAVADKLDLRMVPVRGIGTLGTMVDLVKHGDMQSDWGAFPAEGIVARPTVELVDRAGRRVITKLKRKDFPTL